LEANIALLPNFDQKFFCLRSKQFVHRREGLVELYPVTQIVVSSGTISRGQCSRPACHCCIFYTLLCAVVPCATTRQCFQHEFSSRSLLLLNLPKKILPRSFSSHCLRFVGLHISCKTVALPTLCCVTSHALLLIYLTVAQ